MASTYSDGHFQSDQEPIRTTNAEQFAEQVDLWRTREHDSPEVGVVIGPPGTGKTTAAKLYFTIDQNSMSTHTGCLLIRVAPRMTPRGLLDSISDQIDNAPRSPMQHVAFERARTSLEQCRVKLLVLDEADNLRDEHLQELRLLLWKVPCSLLLIGLPDLLPRIEKLRKLSSHSSFSLEFLPLSDEEMLTSFLPQLTLPGWVFDAKNVTDLSMGEYLWRNTRPSLRRLITILTCASLITQHRGALTITIEQIRLAVLLMIFKQEGTSGSQSNEEDR